MEIDEHTNSQDEIIPGDGANQTSCFDAVRKFHDAPSRDRPCIHRVFKVLFQVDPLAYAPHVISIGPLHRNNPTLDQMQKQKVRCVKSLLTRAAQTNLLQECFNSVLEIEKRVRGCYSEAIPLNSRQFVELIVLDGLFIVDLLYKVDAGLPVDNDPIFGIRQRVVFLCRDMLMLENQIPMFVLERLMEVVLRSKIRSINLTETALDFFNNIMWREERLVMKYFDIQGKHFLDLLHQSFRDFNQEGLEAPDKSEQKQLRRLRVATELVEAGVKQLRRLRVATELVEAGVTFKKRTDFNSILEIKFEHGVIRIPPIVIDDGTNCLLRNLIAYEQSSNEVESYITSYAYLMDGLIDSPQDVAILVKSGIIENLLGHDDRVCSLLNNLATGATISQSEFHYNHLCRQVTKYTENRWHQWRANLVHNYLNTPWSVMSVGVAITLLILAFISTVFTVLTYYKKC